jgi:hypothetical protein
MSTATQIAVDQDAAGQVMREGESVLTISVRQEHGEVVVTTQSSAGEKPYRFGSLETADAFLSDLMTSFSYLGCDIAPQSN